MLRSFCVIIPMFNEESGAEVCVRTVCPALAAIPYPSKLITVNDGSRDRTGAILDRLAPELPKLLVVHHAHNAGYGAALRTGIQKAAECSFDYALFMDSDLTNDPADIPKFVALMEQGIDVIKASRFIGGGGMDGVPWQRSIFSHTGNLVARPLFHNGVRDCTNGFRAVKVDILKRMDLHERGFPIIVEELYQARFLARTYAEVPVVLTSRTADQRNNCLYLQARNHAQVFRLCLESFSRHQAAFETGDPLMRTHCRACNGTDLHSILDLGALPLAGGFLANQEAIAKEQLYPLEIHSCGSCGLVQLLNPVDPEILFQDYSFSSSTIKPLVDHFAAYAGWLQTHLHPRGLSSSSAATTAFSWSH